MWNLLAHAPSQLGLKFATRQLTCGMLLPAKFRRDQYIILLMQDEICSFDQLVYYENGLNHFCTSLAFRNRHIILLLGGPKNFGGKCSMVNCGTQWAILTELNGWMLHELPWNHDSFVTSTLGMCPCMAFILQYFVKYTAVRVPHHFTDEIELDRCNMSPLCLRTPKATSK